MKKYLLLLLIAGRCNAYSQDQEIQQLILNVEKLAQFKQILSDMKTGYEIVSKGYSTIRDVSQGNFSLHKVFLDGLLAVSPVVRNYYKCAAIISDELSLVKEYKQAYQRFKTSGNFSPDDLVYLSQVYGHLFKESLAHIDDLTNAITADRLRMNDEERLATIDRIYAAMHDKLLFLRSFNGKAAVLSFQRSKEQQETETVKKMIR